jgi:hypothetical protein
MAVLQWLETTRLSILIREGDTIWGYPTILTLHTFGMGLLVGPAAVIDLLLLGIGGRTPMAPMRQLFGLMWVGFWLNAITGTILFAAQATTRGTSALFLAKLLLVALGIATTVFIKRTVVDAPADQAARPNPKLLAFVSLFAWTATVTSGRLLAYVP